jgi:Tfp pilus assembly protein FimT
VAMLSVALISIWSSFEYGRSMAGYNSLSADATINELKVKLAGSEAEIIASQRRATMLKSNSRIDDDASVQLKETLVQAQSDVLELKKELSFYKSIVAPEKSRNLVIQTVQLKPIEDGRFSYTIMVSQQGRNDKLVRGTLAVSIKGVTKGKEVTLSLADVTKDLKTPVKFGFKYFQNFEGVMDLPVAFQPDSLRIEVKPGKGKLKALDEQFAWAELTAGES